MEPREAVIRVVELMRDRGVFPTAGAVNDDIDSIIDELNEPLRVAVVGKTNAGKSTLINCLVGASAAPTDALSCTKFAAWYRDDQNDWAQARLLGERRVVRIPAWPPRPGTMIADGVSEEAINDIHVWRKGLERLKVWTVIDTPGHNDFDPDVRDRTRRVFVNEDIDAIVFVLNGAAAEEELRFFTAVRQDLATLITGSLREFQAWMDDFGVVNTIAVLSRIDMADHRDPFGGARKVIDQHADELRGIATVIIPVIGLLAETANQLSDSDFAALSVLKDLREHQLTPQKFRTAADRLGLTLDSIERLSTLFGGYGLGFAISQIRDGGVTSRRELSEALWEHSGLSVLEEKLRERLTTRVDALKARTAVRRLMKVRLTGDVFDILRPYLVRVLRLDGMQPLREFDAYERWQSGDVALPAHIGPALTALLFGRDRATRTGLVGAASKEQIEAALWQRIGECADVLAEFWPAATLEIVRMMRRSYSIMLNDLTAGDNP
jgi:GTPase SAR1 family protein